MRVNKRKRASYLEKKFIIFFTNFQLCILIKKCKQFQDMILLSGQQTQVTNRQN